MLRKINARDERGQSLVIVVLAMVVMVGMAAVAIDIASWYQKHHRAQVAADAAALAAAHCLASLNCTTTNAASTVATSYASTNGVPISTDSVAFSSTNITVTTQAPAPPLFAKVLGFNTVTATAKAVATWYTTFTSCGSVSSGGANCYAIFAYDHTCGSQLGVFNNGNTTSVTGGVHSNGSLNNVGNGGASQFLGPNSYGGPNNCTASGVTNPTFNSHIIPYPVDYSGLSPMPGNNATPPACTVNVTGSYTYTGGSGVYCDPNGTITVGAGTSVGGATFIAQNILLNANNASLVPYNWPTNPLLLYQTAGGWTGSGCSSTSATLDIGTGHTTFEGWAFAPCSTILFTSNNSIWNPAFLEGYDVSLQGNSFTGDGPAADTGGRTLAGQDFLLQ
jgi:Flp pilus assembly protein TadG